MELEAMASNSNSNSSTSTSTAGGDDSSPPTAVVVKGKRTKRPRAPSSSAPATSSTSSADLSGTTEEEEDMAHCLILLAQGAHRSLPAAAAGPAPPTAEKFVSRRFAEAATSAGGAKAGFYVYECKTCSKCFPSFQALGGHRASHKKPKLQPAPPLPLPPPPATATSPDDYHRKPPVLLDEASLEITMNSFSAKQAVSAGKTSRVHECSICGSEFSSGQALGGHMRRHRLAVVPDSPDVKKEQRNVLSLDLNLPAPSDEERTADLATAFSFGGGRQMVFPATAAALVDCHY